MMVEYTPSIDDMVALNVHISQHSPSVRQSLQVTRVVVGIIVPVVGITTAYILAGGRPAFPFLVLLSLALGAAVFYGFPRVIQQQMHEQAVKLYNEGRRNGLEDKQTLILTSDGVELRSASTEERLQWTAIEQVAVTKQHVFLYRNPTQAIIVPTNAFTETGQRSAFIQLAQHYHTTALRRPTV